MSSVDARSKGLWTPRTRCLWCAKQPTRQAKLMLLFFRTSVNFQIQSKNARCCCVTLNTEDCLTVSITWMNQMHYTHSGSCFYRQSGLKLNDTFIKKVSCYLRVTSNHCSGSVCSLRAVFQTVPQTSCQFSCPIQHSVHTFSSLSPLATKLNEHQVIITCSRVHFDIRGGIVLLRICIIYSYICIGPDVKRQVCHNLSLKPLVSALSQHTQARKCFASFFNFFYNV